MALVEDWWELLGERREVERRKDMKKLIKGEGM
jgi:hypothetical protein